MAPGFDERGVIVSRILRPGNPPAGSRNPRACVSDTLDWKS